ncbi:MAG: hypothetical protein H6R14_2573 [Proteobacteria bacterium]|nr:hypothetical protein [Pseudomonadota bacterium]
MEPVPHQTPKEQVKQRLRRAYYEWQNRAMGLWFRGWPALLFIFGICLAVIGYWAVGPALQAEIGELDKDRLTAVETLLVTVGGSLIGATAIVSAMVVYALQVNVERMPHALFRRLSSDLRLMLAFVGTVLLACLIASLAMVVTQNEVVLPLFTALWSLILVLILFGYAYRRTLDLVNPSFQLNYIVKRAQQDLARWEKFADKALPAVAQPKAAEDRPGSTFDAPRLKLLLQFPQWTGSADESLFYAASLASHYASKGDFGVVNAAYSAILAIHASYLRAKGNTFVAANGFMDSPLIGDSFISGTLESLRQTHREAITQGNERYMLANLQVLAKLAELYLRIDYGSSGTNKTHANLAAHYLAGAIKEVLPHNRPDILMQGVRLLSHHAQCCIAFGGPDHLPELTQRIAEIALVGIVREDHFPVTVCAMEELGKLSLALLTAMQKYDLRFPLHELRDDIHNVALLLIKNTKDSALGNRHSQALAGYYSAQSGFLAMLEELANQLLQAEADNKHAQQIIRNIREWCDQLYLTQKDLLITAVEAQSPFVSDMVFWITHVTEILAALSAAPACNGHNRENLEKDATRLLCVLSWLPDDKDSVARLAPYQVHERLFECAMHLYGHGCFNVAKRAASLLLSWAFRAGRYQNGWGTLEHAMYCVAVLSLRPELQAAVSHDQIQEMMEKYPVPQEILDRTAQDIRSKAESPFQSRMLPGIEHELSQEDPETLVSVLTRIANLLSPHTANDPVPSRFGH